MQQEGRVMNITQRILRGPPTLAMSSAENYGNILQARQARTKVWVTYRKLSSDYKLCNYILFMQ